jgi:hypothetical protein
MMHAERIAGCWIDGVIHLLFDSDSLRTPQGLPTDDTGSELYVTGLSQRRVTGQGNKLDFRIARPTADRSDADE